MCCSVCVCVTVRFPTCLCDRSILCCCIYCVRKPAGTKDTPKQFKESPERVTQNGDCRWSTASGCIGTAPTTIWFRSGSTGGKQVRTTQVFSRREEDKAASKKLEELDSALSNVLLCESGGANCVIIAPRSSEQSRESVGRGGSRRWVNGCVQQTAAPKICMPTCMQHSEIRPTDLAPMRTIASSD